MTRKFFWVGNHVGLDFLNTAAADSEGEPLELLPDADAVHDWVQQARLLDAKQLASLGGQTTPAASELVAWVHALRRRGRDLLDPAARAYADSALDLDEIVGSVPVRLTYRAGAGTRASGVAVATTNSADVLRLVLARVVLDATELDRSRIHRCDADRCVLLFFDTSRNRLRRWCDMATCGNRAKAAAHYRRSREIDRGPQSGVRHRRHVGVDPGGGHRG